MTSRPASRWTARLGRLGRLGRLFGDTLARRLFLLMWLALVGSHVLAFAVVRWVYLPDHGANAPMPTFPSLPPLMRPGPQFQPGLGPAPGQPSGQQPGPQFEFHDDFPGQGPYFGPHPQPFPQPMMQPQAMGFARLGTQAVLLDYGLRLLVIALAAWLGSRWLARPMRELLKASRGLGDSLERQRALPLLDAQQGTLEVRETAQVFNAMAQQLRRQFNERGLMLAAISHDLRTPLTRLRMRLETLEIEEPQRERSVDDIREMNALIDSVMELFRGEGPGAHEPSQGLDLAALVQALVDDRQEQGQAVEVAPSAATQDLTPPDTLPDPVLAQAQPMALRRVLDNLVGNALRYAGHAELSAGRDAQGAWVRVADHGPGIPAEQLESVFEPFYRLETSRNRHTGGTGLGLYIARELMRRQGGQLRLSNRPEGGLLAELRLP